MLTVLAELSSAGHRRSPEVNDLADSGDHWPDIQPDAFGLSDVGRSRETNDDRFLVATLQRALAVRHSNFPGVDSRQIVSDPQAWLFCVADGVGGIAGGDMASAIAIDAVCAHALRFMPWPSSVDPQLPAEAIEGLRRAMIAAQHRMQRIAESRGMDRRLGTTLTAAIVAWPELLVVHVGDSRAYLLEDGRLHRLTRDHTLAEALREGGIDVPEEAATAGMLVNAVGGGSDHLAVDVVTHALRPGARLLLATDGLTRYLDDAELTQRIAASDGSEAIVRSLVAEALARGGEDNVTALVAAF
ncbi:MAG TPA: protein phosphatase 2C domain-containing protein [Nannocystaceae bacterium]|nr:protein phosphatase 2C domain-containing protein [Nannocystaceae bacterium]